MQENKETAHSIQISRARRDGIVVLCRLLKFDFLGSNPAGIKIVLVRFSIINIEIFLFLLTDSASTQNSGPEEPIVNKSYYFVRALPRKSLKRANFDLNRSFSPLYSYLSVFMLCFFKSTSHSGPGKAKLIKR